VSRRRLLAQIGSASFLIGVGFVFQALADVFLARHLTRTEYGYFTLIFRDAANIIAMMVLLGLDSSLIRSVGAGGVARFAWRRLLQSTVLLLASLSLLLALVVKLIYGVGTVDYLLLVLLVTLFGIIALGATVLRIEGRTTLAQFGTHLWRMVFALAVILFFFLGMFDVSRVVGLLIVSVLVSVIAILVMIRSIPEGTERLDRKRLLVDGVVFFGLSSSSLMMVKVERFFLGGIGSFADVGAYYAVSVAVVTVYGIAASGGSYVLLPHFAQGGTVHIRRNLLLLVAVGAAIAVPYLVASGPIIHLLYNGRYDNVAYLVPLFLVIGMLQLVYLLPSSYVGGKAESSVLRKFLLLGLSALSVNVILCIILIPRIGLTGAASATAIAWFVRVAGGLWFTRVTVRGRNGGVQPASE